MKIRCIFGHVALGTPRLDSTGHAVAECLHCLARIVSPVRLTLDLEQSQAQKEKREACLQELGGKWLLVSPKQIKDTLTQIEENEARRARYREITERALARSERARTEVRDEH